MADEEKFYPIVGADGSVQVIKAPAEPKKKSKSAKPVQSEPTAASAEKSAEPAPAPRAGAAYDSDEYVDSEALESQQSNAPGKNRFYMIPDQLGTQINEGERVFDPADAESSIMSNGLLAEPFISVDENTQVLVAGQLGPALSSLPQCLGKEEIADTTIMEPGVPQSLVLGKEDYGFLKPPGIAGAYRITGDGLRTVVASSFSRTDRKPGFVHPYLAFFDGQGCLTRVITNFYESFYRANQRRHPMLKANVTVHTGESFMLVIVPQESSAKSVTSLPYGYSRYGQLKFTVKKQ